MRRRHHVDNAPQRLAYRVVLGVGHNRRFWPSMQALKRMVAAGELGTLLHVEGHFSNEHSNRVADGWRLLASESPGGGMTDLGTLKGSYSSANALNDAGRVVGSSSLPGDDDEHAEGQWRRTGAIGDLQRLVQMRSCAIELPVGEHYKEGAKHGLFPALDTDPVSV